jgi:hypothetical protein
MISLSNLLGSPLGVPGKFYSLLALYHLLPLHFPITTWGYDVPWGRFSTPSILNLNGGSHLFLLLTLSSLLILMLIFDR